MTTTPVSTTTMADLTDSQLAAVARLHHAVRERAAAAVLVGPAGAGKSTVLAHLGRLVDGQPHRVIDDAHLLSPQAVEELARELAASRGPTVILAGQGRLLSLVGRDTRLESKICLRAVVGAMGPRESRTLAAGILGEGGEDEPRVAPKAFVTIHEIACGMPRGVVALARLARILLDEEPRIRLDSWHVESLHTRLALTAA
jgi:ABC-type dipeptide/oligopeptide/nickel transport system ATPase component